MYSGYINIISDICFLDTFEPHWLKKIYVLRQIILTTMIKSFSNLRNLLSSQEGYH